MPTSADAWAVDTSVAVAAIDGAHAAHRPCRDAMLARRPALAGHAAFETFSVLTRMPGQLAVDAPVAIDVIDRLFPERCWIDAAQARELLTRCGALGIRGGAVYDGLVGESASLAGRTLLTRDLRARRTYDLLGIEYELVGL